MDLVPSDPSEHAQRFAKEYVDRLEHFVEGRRHSLDIPEEQIGSSDPERLVPWRTFFPDERIGGSVATGGRISVDSGVLNSELLTLDHGAEAGKIWGKSRLRDRIDSIIVHELAESQAETHEDALALAQRTDRKITEATRRILKAMERGWRR